MALVPPGHPAVAADGDLPGAAGPVVVPRVEEHVAVLQLDDAAFVDLVSRSGTAQPPGFPVVVAVDDMGVVVLRTGLYMIAGNQQASRRKLDAVARTGGVPGPVRLLGGCRDVPRLAPRAAVVLARRDPHGPRALARSVDDLGFAVDAQVVGHRQPDGPGLTVDHGTGIAAGVPRVPPDHLLVRPGVPAVLAALHQQVDVARIAPAGLAAFAEGEDRSPDRHDDRGNAVGIVSVRAAGPPDGLFKGADHGLSGSAVRFGASGHGARPANWMQVIGFEVFQLNMIWPVTPVNPSMMTHRPALTNSPRIRPRKKGSILR